MTSTLPWSAVRALFDQAVPLAAGAREALLADAALDPRLAAEVRSLLAHHDAGAGLSGGAAAAVSLSQALQPNGNEVESRQGQHLGPWRIVSLLGRGGMGEVWLAERADQAFEGEAAIKVLRRGMDSDSVLARFALEQRSLARLTHPHIARLLDAGRTASDLPYFVMERVQGRPIDQACRGRTLDERLVLFLQLAEAVSHAHRHLLVHRDLKPSNVLVDDEARVKLLDFGIAKAIDPLEGTESLTTVGGERPFTPHYASPEQVRGEPVSTATDIYSLGVLLYQMLTGARPTGRAATTPLEAARCVIEEEPARPSRLSEADAPDPMWPAMRRRMRGDLDNILLKALEKAAERRYASVDALAADLRAFVEGRPVSARGATPGYVLAKFVRRNRWAALAVGLGAAGLATGLVATLLQGRLATALGGAGLAAGLGLALWQGRKAELARERAERHVGELRTLAREVVVEYGDAITHVPGGHERKARLLETTASYLERLVRSPGGDGELGLQAELATIHARLAELRSTREHNAAPNLPEAERHARRAIELCSAVHARRAAEAPFYRWWARALIVRAEAAQQLRRDFAAALAAHEEADRVLQRALELHPLHQELRRVRADNIVQMAEVLFGWNKPNLGQPKEALAMHARALPMYEAGFAADEAAAAYDLHQYGTTLGTMALIHARLEDWPEALHHSHEALRWRERASQAEPHNQMYRGAVAAESNLAGGLHLNVGDASGALVHTERAWRRLEELLAAEPGHDSWVAQQRSLAFNHGRALLASGLAEAAIPVLAVSADWLGPLLAGGRAEPVHRRRLALTWLAQAEAMQALGADGRPLADRAALLAEESTAQHPEDRDAWQALGQCAAVLSAWPGSAGTSTAASWQRSGREAYATAERMRPLTAEHARRAAALRGQAAAAPAGAPLDPSGTHGTHDALAR